MDLTSLDGDRLAREIELAVEEVTQWAMDGNVDEFVDAALRSLTSTYAGRFPEEYALVLQLQPKLRETIQREITYLLDR